MAKHCPANHQSFATMDFFSMGMFCIDEIHLNKQVIRNMIGGAGTYAVLGAAVSVPAQARSKVGFICDEGYDFPQEMHQTIASWGTGTIFRTDNTRETTKAWNKFVDDEERLFKYLSPKKQIFAADMPEEAQAAKVVHLICSPQRAAEFLKHLKSDNKDQKYIWEPVPTECLPSQYGNLKQVIQEYGVTVLSPNALEAAALVGLSEPKTRGDVEELVEDHFAFVPCIIVRCGAMGCFLRSQTLSKWYPAYYENRPEKVVDPSGAGNAFMGGMGLGLAQGLDWDHVVAFASVGASFMIEQIGPPSYNAPSDEWNGESGCARVELYLRNLEQI